VSVVVLLPGEQAGISYGACRDGRQLLEQFALGRGDVTDALLGAGQGADHLVAKDERRVVAEPHLRGRAA
jgi:hypothetical protein